jgi:hypothetical protein
MQRENKARLSLAPLKFREAVSDLLKIKPETKTEATPKATRTNISGCEGSNAGNREAEGETNSKKFSN